MKDTYGIMRIVKTYECLFDDSQKLFEDLDFHIEQLTNMISKTEVLLDVISEEIRLWSEAIEEIYKVNDAFWPWQKIQVFIMKKYVNYNYIKSCDEAVIIENARKKLCELLWRIERLKCF